MQYRIVAKCDGLTVDSSSTGHAETAASAARALLEEGYSVTVYDSGELVEGSRFVREREVMREYRSAYRG